MGVNDNLNLTFCLCCDFDENSKNVMGIQNEIITEDGEATLNFFIMVSGVNCEQKNYRFDFIIECVEPLKEIEGKASYLFTMEMIADKNDSKQDIENNVEKLKSRFEGAVSEVNFLSKKIKFPCDGRYEIQAYLFDGEEESVKERLKKRHQYTPKAVYPLRIVCNRG